jgi:hypothetical protein
MRIRDGAFSLEAAIRSHIEHFDEIVAVHNRSSDATPAILARLSAEYGPRLRVFHYLPAVFPPGSAGHTREPAGSPHSLVNYYNFALAQTRFSHATKLDDDHVAMSAPLAALVADVRAGRAASGEIACFSGINLARDSAGRLGVLSREPFAGSGDHWIFPVSEQTYFVWDRRFERLQQGGLRRRFHSIAYWHLKHLKPEFGFANYDLADNPRSRYARRLRVLKADHRVIDLDDLADVAAHPRGIVDRLVAGGLPLTDRGSILADRRRAAARLFRDRHLREFAAPDRELAPFLSP